MTRPEPRMTRQTQAVLRTFAAEPTRPMAGSEIARSTGLLSGTLYPILARLESSGWLQSEWEDLDPSEAGRPRKRLYTINALGLRQAERILVDRELPEGGVSWAF